MMIFDELTEKNVLLYAAKYYYKPQFSDVEEFYEDLARFKYILRLLRKYNETGLIQERLVLNHIIVIYNVFEIHAANRMMFYRIDQELWSYLKPFLIYLNYLPEDNKYNHVLIDLNIAKKLQTI